MSVSKNVRSDWRHGRTPDRANVSDRYKRTVLGPFRGGPSSDHAVPTAAGYGVRKTASK